MRIVFIGSENISKFLLKKCFELKLNIVGVCTQKKIEMMIFEKKIKIK